MEINKDITGKNLEEILNSIRESSINPSDQIINEYINNYKKFYEANVYENKNNNSINSTIYENYNTPKNYLYNFESQEMKTEITNYDKYANIFIYYNKFKDSVLKFINNQNKTNLTETLDNFVLYIAQLEKQRSFASTYKIGGYSETKTQDIIEDHFLGTVNLENGNLAKKVNNNNFSDTINVDSDIILDFETGQKNCEIYQENENSEKITYEDLPSSFEEGLNEKTELTVVNLLSQTQIKSLMFLLKILNICHVSKGDINNFYFGEYNEKIMSYVLSVVTELIKKKDPLYMIYKYCFPIIFNLLNNKTLSDTFAKANNHVSTTVAKYTNILITTRKSDSYNITRSFSDSKYNHTIDLETKLKNENISLYNKFFEDVNKISIISSEMFDDIELIKNIWLRIDHKISTIDNIIFYYTYIFYEYYGKSNEARQIISSNISKVIFQNTTNLVAETDVLRKVMSISNTETVNNLHMSFKNIFYDPITFGVANLFFKFEKEYCVLLDWIKIINMTLNDNYGLIMPWNQLKITKFEIQKSDEPIKTQNYKSDGTESTAVDIVFAPQINENFINIYNAFYIKSNFEVNNENIIVKLANYQYKDNVSNSSNIYGSCINCNYNSLGSFMALIKSNSYKNIKNVYPFVKYGFPTNKTHQIENQIINYYKENNTVNIIGNEPDNTTYTNPNCLEENLIMKTKNNLLLKNELEDYIRKIKTIEKEDAQLIFYNLFTIINVYFYNTLEQEDSELNIYNLFKKFGFPSNLYLVDEIESIQKNCYLKILSYFNNIVYIYYKTKKEKSTSVEDKQIFSQSYKYFVSLCDNVKTIGSEYSDYCGEQFKNPIKEYKYNISNITFEQRTSNHEINTKQNDILNIRSESVFNDLLALGNVISVDDKQKIKTGTSKKSTLLIKYDHNDAKFTKFTKKITESKKIEIEHINLSFNYNNCKFENSEVNINFNFYDIIKTQLNEIINDSYDLLGLTFKDLILNDNIYIRFENSENMYIPKCYRFYKNIYGKQIDSHVLVMKDDYAHKSDFKNNNSPNRTTQNNLTWEIITTNAYTYEKSNTKLQNKFLVSLDYNKKTYESKYSWKNFPSFIVYRIDPNSNIRTKSGTINYPMFLPYLKFIIKYDWRNQTEPNQSPEKIKRVFTSLTDQEKIVLNEKIINMPSGKKILEMINDNRMEELEKYLYNNADNINTKATISILTTYLNGYRIEEWLGVNKINGEKIKITNTEIINSGSDTDTYNRVNKYKIILEEKSEKYEYVGIENILTGSETSLLKTLIEKLIEFNEFDTIDIWKKITVNNNLPVEIEFLIKLNTWNINFLIDTNLNIYIENTNNILLKNGDSNCELNKWAVYTNNMFITKNLLTNQCSLNLFDHSTGYISILINRNIPYPQIGTSNKKILNAIKKSYESYNSNPDYNYQNMLELFELMQKFDIDCDFPKQSVRFSNSKIEMNSLLKKYELTDNFPNLNLETVDSTDNESQIKTKITEILKERNVIQNFINILKNEIDREYIYNSEKVFTSNYPYYLLLRLYSNNSMIYNKYFSYMYAQLSLKYFDLVNIGDFDNWNFFVNFHNGVKYFGFDSSPSELFYQFVYGFIAKPEQLNLVNDVSDDLCGSFEQTGGFNFTNIKYNKLISKESQNNGGRIHNLIMGGGKTSMVTPLAVIRSFHMLNSDKKTDESIYLILPSQLVYQSAYALSQYLTTFFPIKVMTLEEQRKGLKNSENNNKYTNSLNFRHCNEKTNNLYILSDVSIKCGFINDHENNTNLVKNNSMRNRYIIDEIDTILNPLVSELNYPISSQSNQTELNTIDNYFDAIFEVLNMFYSNTNEDANIVKFKQDNFNGLSFVPHFNVIDTNLIEQIIDIVKEKMIKYYELNEKTEYVRFLKNEISKEEMFTIDNTDIESFYVLNNFIYECVPTVFTMINRKNYGLHDGSTVIPFAYADTPSTGSEFSNPLIVMCLTMVDYIIQIIPLNDNVLTNMIQFIKIEYNLIPSEIRHLSDIAREYGDQKVMLGNLTIYNCTQKIKDLLRTSKFFIQKCLKYICKDKIKIFKEQLNITGVDLVMYDNIKYKSGFTGTPSIANFYDVDSKNKMQIVPVNDALSKTIDDAILQANKIIKIDSNDRKEYINKIYQDETIQENKNKICVIIDVGAIFSGINAIEVFKMIINVNPTINTLLYWNENDIPKKIKMINDKFIIYDWNLDYEPNSFYYYDHKHTTGTDAKIPIGSIGIALIGKNDRYRDVAQAIFRMRKLTKGHSIVFALDSKTLFNIEKINNEPINTKLLLNWFNSNEMDILQQHQKNMNLYNIRSLFKIIARDVDISKYEKNRHISKRLNNTYNVLNKFYYPDKLLCDTYDLLYNYVYGRTNTDIIDVKNIEEVFKNSNCYSAFVELAKNFSSNGMSISQNLQLSKNINYNINISSNVNNNFKQLIQNIKEPDFMINIGNLSRYINIKLKERENDFGQIPTPNLNSEIMVDNYYYVEPRQNLLQNQYIAKNFYYFIEEQTELTGYWLYEYSQSKLYLIPLIEGIKLVDFLNSNVEIQKTGVDLIQRDKFINTDVYDTEGNLIYTNKNIKSDEYLYEVKGFYSYIRFMSKMFDPNKEIFLSDYYNLFFVSIDKLKSLLEKYDSIEETDILKSHSSNNKINTFFSILRKYVVLTNDSIREIKLSLDNFFKYSASSENTNINNCLAKINSIKLEINTTAHEVFNSVIDFFTFNKKFCYKLTESTLIQKGGSNYKQLYIDYKIKYCKLKHK